MILEPNIEYPCREIITYFDDGEDIVRYIIEIRCNYSGMRKIIDSSGDIIYRRRGFGCNTDWCVDVFWYGIESGVCESCQHVSGRYHPIWYKTSEKNYHGIDYKENRILQSIPTYTPSYYRVSVQCELECLHSLRLLMRYKKLPITLGEAVNRHQLHISEEIMRNRLVANEGDVASNWLITSEVRRVEQPCACLCTCGHRNTNYTKNGKASSIKF